MREIHRFRSRASGNETDALPGNETDDKGVTRNQRCSVTIRALAYAIVMGSCCTKLHRDDVVSPDEEKLVEARSGGEARGEYGSTALASTAIATTTDSGPRPPSKRPDKPSTVEESGLVRIKFGAAGERSKCAYCDREDGDLFDYIFCPEMGLDLLEGLMERGWWRTGHVIFKPRSREVCCPTYTTR